MTAHKNDKLLNKPSRRSLLIVCSILSVVGGIVLIGIPGALLIGAVGWFLELSGIGTIQLSGDDAWPVMIMISLLWPFLMLPVSTWMQRQLPNIHSGLHWLLIIILSLFITQVIIFVWLGLLNS